ncbi:MAG: hypothetical protein ACOZJZ_10345 [Pseudomonadota bacterium]
MYTEQEMQKREALAKEELARAQAIVAQQHFTPTSLARKAITRFSWPFVLAYLLLAVILRREAFLQQFIAAVVFIAVALLTPVPSWFAILFLLALSVSSLLRYRAHAIAGT